jgi:hypothetical protein
MIEIFAFSTIFPLLTTDLGTEKKFSCFLKSMFNQAQLTKQITGQKEDLKQTKAELKKLLTYALKEGGESQSWARRFMMQDII